jgi:Uma2 family endonuclease
MATTKPWTVEELERDPPEGRWELVDGELVEMAPSGGEASTVGGTVVYFLNAHVRPRKLGKVYSADGGFVIFPGRELLRAPDAAFVKADRLAAGRPAVGFERVVPDLVVEVVSPGDRPGEVAAKVAEYLAAGVRLIWVLEPRPRTVTVHPAGQAPRVLGEGDELDGGEVLPGFRVAVAELFA